MKKTWKQPICLTMRINDLEQHIKVAARSGCDSGVFR